MNRSTKIQMNLLLPIIVIIIVKLVHAYQRLASVCSTCIVHSLLNNDLYFSAIYILVGLIMCTGSVALTVINVNIYNKTSPKPSLRLRKICASLERVVFCGTCFGKQKTSTKVNTISVKPADQEKGAFKLDNANMDISLTDQDEPE